jgi:glycosyltransferase involved in cell wall biosynthesis
MAPTDDTAEGEAPDPAAPEVSPEVSVVLPCLDESDTLAVCIEKAQRALAEAGVSGEIVVADNGSTDGSREIARGLGARVVEVAKRGYGNALQAGIAAARAPFVVMGDADDSYDFLELPKFIEKAREGHDLVQGCRLPSGGGRILPGAMPPLHRWVGNPLFTLLARRWFRAPIHDVYCGLRGFRKEAYERLDLRCTGMEFATEMIVKMGLFGMSVAEVPITLHPDGRKSHEPHLRTFRDGWRTLRFLLLYSPRWLFAVPGAVLLLLGAAGFLFVMPGLTLGGVNLDAHTLLFAALLMIAGYQSILFGTFAKLHGVRNGLLPDDPRLRRWLEGLNTERALLLGTGVLLAGLALLVGAVLRWRAVDFGDLDYSQTMRLVIPGVTLSVLGFQTQLACFYLDVLRLPVR